MKKIILTACFLCLFCINAEAQTKVSCSQDKVCIHREQLGNSVSFYVENKTSFDVTVTITADIKNMLSTHPLPFTETFFGNSKSPAFQIFQNIEGQKWKYNYNYFWKLGSRYAIHNDNYIYRLPYSKNDEVETGQTYLGTFSHKNEYAVDFRMPVGIAVHAAREGTVISIKQDSSQGGKTDTYKKHANYVYIQHDDETIAKYSHLAYRGVQVKVGQVVSRGQFIARSGNTGYSTRPHLHFEVYSPLSGKKKKTLPVKFNTQDGIIFKPETRKFYKTI